MAAEDHVAVVTGANGGIGKGLALKLAERGGTVVMVCRDPVRGAEAQAEVRHKSGNQHVDLVIADLTFLASVRRLGSEIRNKYPHVNVLINNAAVAKNSRETTADGYEVMFATNHLAPFLLTRLLLTPLRDSGSGRVLNISAPTTTKLDFKNLQGEREFNGLNQFGATKMANLLFTFGAAHRWDGSGVAVNAIHPGLVRSNLMREANFMIRLLTGLFSRTSPEKAAEPIVQVATSADYAGQSGRFYHKGKEIKADPYAYDQAVQDGLWEVSEMLVGI